MMLDLDVDFKSIKPALPLARIKKIMKSDEDVRMISAEAPVLFAKACELFILDLSMRAWYVCTCARVYACMYVLRWFAAVQCASTFC